MSRILVVDDDRTTRHVLRKVLTSAGFAVTVAKDGVEALTVLRTRRFDLLLLDVWMPRMNGLDLLERLRTRKARPRVVVMTSDEAPETLLEAVRQQAFQVRAQANRVDRAASDRARCPQGARPAGD